MLWRLTMATRCGLVLAAVMLAMSVSGVRACDDFEEEMALAAAREAVKVSQVAADDQAPSAQASALTEAATTVVGEPANVSRQPTMEIVKVLAR
jgi:hypothetical protein